jgi:predicted nucleic acid-binding protein
MGIKVWAYVALATILVGAGWTAYSKIYNAGYSAAVNEFQGQALQLAERRVKEARRQWDLSAEAASVQIVVEERIVERVREVEREIPRVIETVRTECRDLGSDVMRVYNDAIIAATATAGNAADTSEPN